MAESQVSICNKALAHIGISEKIVALTDDNPEADECEKAYDAVLDETLAKFDWGFARRLFTLIVAGGTPPDAWAHQYDYPTTVVRALRIDDGLSSRQSTARLPFSSITTDAGARLILTNIDNAKLWHTHRETNVAIYPLWYVQTLSFQLAAEIVMPLTSNENLAKTIRERALISLSSSIAHDSETEQEDPEPQAGWVDFRDGPTHRSRGIAAHDHEFF